MLLPFSVLQFLIVCFQYSNGGGMHDPMYNIGNNMNSTTAEGNRYNSYGFDQHGRMNSAQSTGSGSTALYHHHGSRYGLGGRMVGPDSKMNGLHGPKHKRGDVDRECMYLQYCYHLY